MRIPYTIAIDNIRIRNANTVWYYNVMHDYLNINLNCTKD